MSILALRRKQIRGSKKRKFPIKEKAKMEGKEIPNQRARESKKKKKKKENSRSRIGKTTEEICRKVFGLDNI